MEESPHLQNFTLIPSETVFYFPHHGRRPLRSRTYRAVVGLLSHCRSDFSQLQVQGVALAEVAIGDLEYRSVCEENGSTSHNEVNSVDASVPHHKSKVLDDTVVQATAVSENKENFCFQDRGNDGKSTTESQVDHMNVVRVGEHEVDPANKISGDFLDFQNQIGDCAVHVAKDPGNENMKNVTDTQMAMSEFGTVGELEVDKEFCIDDFSEVLDSCFGMDMVVESSKAGEEAQENRIFWEDNIPKEAEYELQLKEMELEKLMHNSGVVELSCQLNADDEIEEGEISGDAGLADGSFDVLSEDASSMGDRKTQVVHAYEDCITKELTSNDEDRGLRQHEISDPWLVNVVNSHTDPMKMESRTSVQKMQDYHSHNVSNNIHRENKKIGPQDTCLENLTPPGRILQENAADNQISGTTEKDQDANKKKRKKCPLTKERRAKKKKNERIKRAEKNRKLGVKRLKLQPVTKPKKIIYCRHFLQGRCHEGEKCNFSHDTVPLTKSTPCGHFARHSCMKGDDCPFDHQLSKYPCRNYTANGFCSRGSDCLFSHEMPAQQNSSLTPNAPAPELTSGQHTVPDKGRSLMISQVTKPELKLPSSLNNLTTSKHTDSRGISHQKTDAKLCLAGSSPAKSAELHPRNPVPRIAGKAPRGVSFLLNGGISSADSSKHKRDGPSVKTTDGVDVGGGKTVFKVPVSPNKLNEISERAAPRKPRGVNFLSFAQPSLDDPTSKIISNLPLNSNNETGKSVMYNMNESKLTLSLPESDGILRVNRQMNQSHKDLAQKLNQNFNGTPLTPHFLSFDKTRLDDSILKETANFLSDKGDSAPPFFKERQSIANKLQDTFQMPSLSFGSPSTSGQNTSFSRSFKPSLLSNTPSVVQKAIQSTLAFAEKFEPDIRVGSSLHQC